MAVHIFVSVGLLGLSTALFALALAAVLTSDFATTQAAYRATGIFMRGVVQTVAVLTLLPASSYRSARSGVFQHTWIVVKIGLMAATILNGMLNLGPAVQEAIALTANASAAVPPDLSTTALVIAVSGLNVLMLGAAMAISVCKPRDTLRRRATLRSLA